MIARAFLRMRRGEMPAEGGRLLCPNLAMALDGGPRQETPVAVLVDQGPWEAQSTRSSELMDRIVKHLYSGREMETY